MLKPGVIVAGRYRVRELLARGGMSAIYVAEHVSTEERVALKVLWPHVLGSKAAVEGFQLEARLAARVGGEHVVRVLDAGFDEGLDAPFLAMELLRGATPHELVKQGGPLSPAEVVAVMRHVARALDRAHGHVDRDGRPSPIVHRDLKPENLFVALPEGGGVVVKVLDFGIAKVVSEGHRYSAEVRGTPMFMASEQVDRGPATAQLDVWPFGLIAFYLLTGQYYWLSAANDPQGLSALLNEILLQPLVAPSERLASRGVALPFDGAFDAWFLRCVDRNPWARFASTGEAAEALGAALGSPTGAELEQARAALACKVAVTLEPGAPDAAQLSTNTAPTGESAAEGGASTRAPGAATGGPGAARGGSGAATGEPGAATRAPGEPGAAMVTSGLGAAGGATRAAAVGAPAGGAAVRVAAGGASEDGAAVRVAAGGASEGGAAVRVAAAATGAGAPLALAGDATAMPGTTTGPSTMQRAGEAAGSASRGAPWRRRALAGGALAGGALALAALAALGLVRPRFASKGAALATSLTSLAPSAPTFDAALAELAAARANEQKGEYQVARELAGASFDKAARVGHLPLQAEALEQRGRAESQLGDYVAAAASFEQAARGAVDARAEGVEVRARLGLAFALSELGTFDGAREQLGRAKVLAAKQPGAEALEVELLSVEGWAFFRESKYERAAATLRKALAASARSPAPNPAELALLHNRLGSTLGALRHFDEALGHLKREDEIASAAFGPDHPAVSRNLSDRGFVLLEMRRYDEAVAVLTRSLAFRPGAGTHRTVAVLNLAEAYEGLGRYAEALEWYEQALRIAVGASMTPDWIIALLDVRRGRTLARLGREAEGLAACERGSTRLAPMLTPDHPFQIEALECVGGLRAEGGQAKAAIAPLERALSLRQAEGDAEKVAAARALLARARAAAGRP